MKPKPFSWQTRASVPHLWLASTAIVQNGMQQASEARKRRLRKQLPQRGPSVAAPCPSGPCACHRPFRPYLAARRKLSKILFRRGHLDCQRSWIPDSSFCTEVEAATVCTFLYSGSQQAWHDDDDDDAASSYSAATATVEASSCGGTRTPGNGPRKLSRQETHVLLSLRQVLELRHTTDPVSA